MIAFEPDELSTVAAPLDEIILRSTTGSPLPTLKYNIGNLPCQRVSVMVSPAHARELQIEHVHRVYSGIARSQERHIDHFSHCQQRF